jgi:hypothetical protein
MPRHLTVIVALFGVALACKPGSPTLDDGASASSSTGDESEGGSGASDDGSSDHGSSDDEATETEDIPPCEPPLLEECWSESTNSFSTCVDACACDDLGCAADCHAALNTNYWACVDQHCQEPWSERCAGCYSTELCEDVCDARRSICTDVDGCDSNMCNYQWRGCNNSCYVCTGAYFEFAYADSCEIVLPGPPDGIGEPFVTIRIGGEQWGLSEKGLGCGDADAQDVVWANEAADRMLLCDPACEAFASLGVAEVQYGCPPG